MITAVREPKVKGRQTIVDALRGLSLLGILVVNIEFIVQPSEVGWFNYTSTVDQLVRWFIIAFGQAKVYPIFAMLFGYGLTIQLRNAKRRGEDLRPLYRRRMIGIAILGVIHGVFFFPGDILVIYAAIGALAYRFRETASPKLIRIAVAVYGLAAAAWLLIGLLDLAGGGGNPPTAPADVFQVLQTGSFFEVVSVRFFYWLVTLAFLVGLQGPAVFASFLVGIALGRTNALLEPDQHKPHYRRALKWGLVGALGGAAGAALTVAGGRWATIGFALGFTAAPFLAASYVAGLALMLSKGSEVWGRVLGAAGRMSLTVYLAESVVVSTVAYGYGFGLFGEVSPLLGLGLAVLIWAGLNLFAIGWLAVTKQGPMERLLRAWTYGIWLK